MGRRCGGHRFTIGGRSAADYVSLFGSSIELDDDNNDFEITLRDSDGRFRVGVRGGGGADIWTFGTYRPGGIEPAGASQGGLSAAS